MAGSKYNVVSSYDIKDDELCTLPTLHRYVWKSKQRCILKYLSVKEKRVGVSKIDEFGRTPIHLAASKGDLKTLQLLLAVNAKTINYTK